MRDMPTIPQDLAHDLADWIRSPDRTNNPNFTGTWGERKELIIKLDALEQPPDQGEPMSDKPIPAWATRAARTFHDKFPPRGVMQAQGYEGTTEELAQFFAAEFDKTGLVEAVKQQGPCGQVPDCPHYIRYGECEHDGSAEVDAALTRATEENP